MGGKQRRGDGKGGGMGWALVILLLLLLAAVSGAVLWRKERQLRQQQALERELEQLAETESKKEAETAGEAPETEETEGQGQEPAVDFEALREKNPDVVGWIRIPDTQIDYPILQAGDNETYLHEDFDGNPSVYGSIFLDCDSKPDFSGWNNPIYGHHMKDGTMFKDVVKFKDEDFFLSHPYFQIETPERIIRLKTVACYYSDSSGIVRRTRFENQEDFDLWVKDRLAPCSFSAALPVSVDSMFVLVTCSYEMEDARTLLFAVEADERGEIVPASGRNVQP